MKTVGTYDNLQLCNIYEELDIEYWHYYVIKLNYRRQTKSAAYSSPGLL